MSQKLFREFIVLFKDWPVDATKRGRCLGEHLRKNFTQSFKKGEFSDDIDVAHWTKVLKDLKPIANNEYVSKYPRFLSTASLGLSKDQCKITLSNQAKKYMYNE
ncbi:ubiquinol-cytochrome-c reductase complex assembly factor 2 [Brachionus plicatilis]|uniref:Mitochondrial nucleoid factor 1 n=1 Tax=Brachionus plicatilis TaxID=10195 RepID=A0A3M7S6L7_BRAPC|nr:ubiquinol-cytochrome-c reductase complex assembly factor 2 [Brachionus plicatilis]